MICFYYVLICFRYSRRILWLRVGRSNNKPEVVASFFLDYIKEMKAVPRQIRMDAGM